MNNGLKSVNIQCTTVVPHLLRRFQGVEGLFFFTFVNTNIYLKFYQQEKVSCHPKSSVTGGESEAVMMSEGTEVWTEREAWVIHIEESKTYPRVLAGIAV